MCSRVSVPEVTPGEAVGENAAQLQRKNASILEMPVPWDYHQEHQQQRSGASLSLEDKLCVLQRSELEK